MALSPPNLSPTGKLFSADAAPVGILVGVIIAISNVFRVPQITSLLTDLHAAFLIEHGPTLAAIFLSFGIAFSEFRFNQGFSLGRSVVQGGLSGLVIFALVLGSNNGLKSSTDSEKANTATEAGMVDNGSASAEASLRDQLDQMLRANRKLDSENSTLKTQLEKAQEDIATLLAALTPASGPPGPGADLTQPSASSLLSLLLPTDAHAQPPAPPGDLPPTIQLSPELLGRIQKNYEIRQEVLMDIKRQDIEQPKPVLPPEQQTDKKDWLWK